MQVIFVNGLAIFAKSVKNFLYTFQAPRNDRTCVKLRKNSKLRTLLMLHCAIVNFLVEMTWPRESTRGCARKHFRSFNEMPLRLNSDTTLSRCFMCFSYVRENTITSFRYRGNICQRTPLILMSNGCWNMAGTFFSPNGICLYRNVSSYEVNAVLSSSVSATKICQLAELQFLTLNTVASRSESEQSSIRRNGYASERINVLRFRHSTKKQKFPFFFETRARKDDHLPFVRSVTPATS